MENSVARKVSAVSSHARGGGKNGHLLRNGSPGPGGKLVNRLFSLSLSHEICITSAAFDTSHSSTPPILFPTSVSFLNDLIPRYTPFFPAVDAKNSNIKHRAFPHPPAKGDSFHKHDLSALIQTGERPGEQEAALFYLTSSLCLCE